MQLLFRHIQGQWRFAWLSRSCVAIGLLVAALLPQAALGQTPSPTLQATPPQPAPLRGSIPPGGSVSLGDITVMSRSDQPVTVTRQGNLVTVTAAAGVTVQLVTERRGTPPHCTRHDGGGPTNVLACTARPGSRLAFTTVRGTSSEVYATPAPAATRRPAVPAASATSTARRPVPAPGAARAQPVLPRTGAGPPPDSRPRVRVSLVAGLLGLVLGAIFLAHTRRRPRAAR